METNFENIMAHIVASIREAGYEPYNQIYGYLKTGDDTYITRTGDARNLIKTLERDQLQEYIDKFFVTRGI
ncbi:MAG: IreB family regulatory phosphoprotein [Oscillospiraceae bacterium]|nr:IreB family regulatory phosphoprotein [Oscillospiraceae bacterium]